MRSEMQITSFLTLTFDKMEYIEKHFELKKLPTLTCHKHFFSHAKQTNEFQCEIKASSLCVLASVFPIKKFFASGQLFIPRYFLSTARQVTVDATTRTLTSVSSLGERG